MCHGKLSPQYPVIRCCRATSLVKDVNLDLLQTFQYFVFPFKRTQRGSSMAFFPFQTPEEGCLTSTHACLSPELEGVSGRYLEFYAIVPDAKAAQRREDQKELCI